MLLNQRAARMAEEKLAEMSGDAFSAATTFEHFALSSHDQQDVNATLPALLQRDRRNLSASEINVYLSYEILSRSLHTYLESSISDTTTSSASSTPSSPLRTAPLQTARTPPPPPSPPPPPLPPPPRQRAQSLLQASRTILTPCRRKFS